MKMPLRITVALAAALFTTSGPAATRTWDGSGFNNLWNNTANWSGNVAPTNGDALVFPDNALQFTNNNPSITLSNLSSISINGDNYSIQSLTPLNLTAGLTNGGFFLGPAGQNILTAALRPRANQTWSVANRSTLKLQSVVSFPVSPLTLTLNINGTLQQNNILQGDTGITVIKRGVGTFHLNNPSQSTVGNFLVASGTLDVSGILNATMVVANGATLQGTGTLSSVVCSGDLRPGGASAGALTFTTTNSLTLQPGARLFVDINGLTPGVDYDQIRTPRSLPLDGAQLIVTRSASFPFAIGQKFVIITNAGANSVVFTTTFTNLPQNSFITNNEVVFQISYTGGRGNDVELTVVDAPFTPTGEARVWDAGAGLGNSGWSSALNWETNTPPQRGDDLIFPASAAQGHRVMTNTFDGFGAEFNRLYFGGQVLPWQLHGNAVKIFGGILATNETSPTGLVQLRCAVELLNSQSWALTNFSLHAFAPVLLNDHTLTLRPSVGTTFHGDITGPGEIIMGSGFVIMNGTLSNVLVRIEGSAVDAGSVQSTGPTWQMTAGELSIGDAQIPGLQAKGGRITFRSGALPTINGNLGFGPNCTVETFFESGDVASVIVTGNIILNNARLVAGPRDLSLVGTTYKLIDNTGANAIGGTFGGLPESAIVSVTNEENGLILTSRISYVGGDGNDVTLTPLVPPSTISSLVSLASGAKQINGFGLAGQSYVLEATTNLNPPVVWLPVRTNTADAGGVYQFIDTASTNFPIRFYRVKSP